MTIDAKFDSLTDRYQLLVGELNAALARLQDQVVTSSATIELKPAQLRTISDSPVQIVPSPGLGKLIVPQLVVASYIFKSQIYRNQYGQSFISLAFDGFPVISSNTPFIQIFGIMAPDLSTSLLQALESTGVVLFPQVGNNTFLPTFGASPLSQLADRALILSGFIGNDDDFNHHAGPIVSSIIETGGSGWQVNDPFTLFSDIDDATGIVDAVSGGAVTAYHLTNPGTAYRSGISQANYGVAHCGILINTVDGSGAVTDYSLLNGTGCTAGRHFSIIDIQPSHTGVGAVGIIDTVDVNGVPLTSHLTDAGTGYTFGTSSVDFSPEGRTGLTLNLTEVLKGDGDLILTVNYTVAKV